MSNFINLPNILTISRIALIPVIILCFFIQSTSGNVVILSIFIFCCITDFLDGYFARAYKQTTRLGQILDPIADKALVATTILFIVGFHKISNYTMIPSCIILCREVMTSEVRDIVLIQNNQFITSKSAKLKTALQMLAISIILASPLFSFNDTILILGECLLWCSSVVALSSGISYYMKHWASISS